MHGTKITRMAIMTSVLLRAGGLAAAEDGQRVRLAVTDAQGEATGNGMQVERETLSVGDHCQTAIWQAGELHVGTVQNMVIGGGQGDHFTHWRRRDGETSWRKHTYFPDHSPSMARILPLADGAALVLYTDRRVNTNRRVFLQRVENGESRQLFDFADGGMGLLNAQMEWLADGRLFVLIPNRVGVDTRRFIVEVGSGAHESLAGIRMPGSGGRIYGILRDGSRLIVPHSIIHKLEILAVNLDDHSHSLHEVDAFTSIAGEPPRETRIFKLADTNQYALVYLRPAAFSDRTGKQGPPTGLVGELVVNVVDAKSCRSVRRTVIAGFQAEAAATHNLGAAQTGPREFVLAHSEVERIHQRHLTGENKNYVGGFISRWRIDANGVPHLLERCQVPPFYGTEMTADEAGNAYLVCRQAGDGDPLHLYTIRPAAAPRR